MYPKVLHQITLLLCNSRTLSYEHFLASHPFKLFKNTTYESITLLQHFSSLMAHTPTAEERTVTVSFHTPVTQNSALPLTLVLIFP